jgi:hypothetical protein
MAQSPPDEVVADHGISGVRTRLKDRSEGKRLFDMLRSLRVQSILAARRAIALRRPEDYSTDGSVYWTPCSPVLKRAVQLFADGLTVREAAAMLRISKSEAGRLRRKAMEDGLLSCDPEESQATVQ